MGQIVKKKRANKHDTQHTKDHISCSIGLYAFRLCSFAVAIHLLHFSPFCSGSARDVQHSSSISLIQICLGECMRCADVRVYLLTMSLMAYGCARVRAASFSEAGTLASCLAMIASNTFCLCIHSISEI